MLIGTHALIPVCACLAADNLAIATGHDRIFPTRSVWVAGVFGTLPDICSPHLSLDDRFASWSHTVWFMVGLIGVAAMTGSFFEKGFRFRVALACWIASALQLAADAVSGGIAWLHPWRTDIIGRYWIPPDQWIWSEAFSVFLAWLLIRIMPHLEARNIRAAAPENPS